MKWDDIKENYIFKDGSKLIKRHLTHKFYFYKLIYKSKIGILNKSISLSSNHLLLCDISKIDEFLYRNIMLKYKDLAIPIEEDIHLYIDESKYDEEKLKELKEELNLYLYKGIVSSIEKGKELELFLNEIFSHNTIVENEPHIVSEKLIWLPMEEIHNLLNLDQKLYCNNQLLIKSYYIGEKDGFCISTDTGKYELNNLIHHNSVSLRNIIFHILTHSNKISCAMVDLKLTEFTRYKKFKDVVGVANSVQETAELLRVARQIMKKRLKEMADLDIDNITKFKPKNPSDKIWISGREINKDTILKVKINNKEKEMKAIEIYNYLHKIN